MDPRRQPRAGVITARAMVSALGPDAATCCAAARAGILRISPIEHLQLASPVTGEPEPVAGHQVGSLTAGFLGLGRLLRLAQGGLRDLARQADLARLGGRVAAYLAVPPAARTETGGALLPDDEARERFAPDEDEDAAPPPAPTELWTRAAVLSGAWPVAPPLAYLSTLGHAGFADVLARAGADLAAGSVDTAVVGALDSLVDDDVVAWLHATARLKCGPRATGVMPGEAAVFFLMERATDVRRRGVHPLADVVAAGPLRDTAAQLAAAAATGVGLSEAIAELGELAGWRQGERAWILTDHNGEEFRALDVGHALVRLRARFPACVDPALWYPAISFGDTGAASGAVAAAVAISAFARGYAPCRAAVAASASDGHERAAFLLAAPARRAA